MVAGKELLIEGRNNSLEDGSLRIAPNRIYELDKFPLNQSGSLKLPIGQDLVTTEFCEIIDRYTDPKHYIQLELIVETEEFSTLLCKTNRKIKVTEEFLSQVFEISGKQPKLMLT